MNFLKQLGKVFVGGPSSGAGGDPGLYYYVRCDRCGEVIKVRINSMNDLSHSDDDRSLFARKTIVGRHCYNRIEAEFTYNNNRQLTNSEIVGGKLVTARDYQDYQQRSETQA